MAKESMKARERKRAKLVAKYAAKYALRPVDRPPFWLGYRLLPVEIEFWQERSFRLHDRWRYRRAHYTDNKWTLDRLYP